MCRIHQLTPMTNIKDLIGKTFTSVTNENDEELVFKNGDGRYVFYHEQDCCESVRIEDIVGDLQDLVGSPILQAAECSSDLLDEEGWSSGTWTFYTFATSRGYVDVRGLGESNGYYSEEVDLAFIPNKPTTH